jgi:DNA polymerase III delta prime subunit
MLSLLDKYKPTSLNDIIGNEENIKMIIEWLNTYEEATGSLNKNGLLKLNTKGRKKKLVSTDEKDKLYSTRTGNLIIMGAHGCGKSTILNLILNDLNYDIIYINEINANEEPLKIYNALNFSDKDKKKIIVIDELDILTKNTEKKYIEKILKNNNYYRIVPIIILSNNTHKKILTSIKKITNIIEINNLSSIEIRKFMVKICKNENINMNSILFDKIIENEKFDIRKILLFLNGLKITYGNIKITNEILIEYENIIKKKDISENLFDVTKKILTTYDTTETQLEKCNTDTFGIPLMIYENYHGYVNKTHYLKILELFSYGEIMESYKFTEQVWDFDEIITLINSVIPSYYINKYNNKNFIKLQYTKDPCNTTVRKNKKKNKIKNTMENSIENEKTYNVNSIEEFIYNYEF